MTEQPDVPSSASRPARTDAAAWLAVATVDAAVFALRPDYRAMLLTADGLDGGESDPASECILPDAEATARQLLGVQQPEQLPHPAAWRDAYRAFGPSHNAPA